MRWIVMKMPLIVICSLLFSSFYAQTNRTFNYQKHISLEVLGIGYVYSINGNKIIKNGSFLKIERRIGFSYQLYNETDIFCIPAAIGPLFSLSKKHHIQFGLCNTFVFSLEGLSNSVWLELSYRLQHVSKKEFLKVSLFPGQGYYLTKENYNTPVDKDVLMIGFTVGLGYD